MEIIIPALKELRFEKAKVTSVVVPSKESKLSFVEPCNACNAKGTLKCDYVIGTDNRILCDNCASAAYARYEVICAHSHSTLSRGEPLIP